MQLIQSLAILYHLVTARGMIGKHGGTLTVELNNLIVTDINLGKVILVEVPVTQHIAILQYLLLLQLLL